MSVPSDSIEFAYQQSYEFLHCTLNRAALLQFVDRAPIDPAAFCITNAEHVCNAAYFGFPIVPHDERMFKAAVAPKGTFTRLVQARIRDVEDRIKQFNAMGHGVQIKYDRKTTTNIGELELLRPVVGDFVDHLIQYDFDRTYVAGKYAAKLNVFAREYHQPDTGAMLAFLRQLDEIARSWGYSSFSQICVPRKFIDHLAQRHAGKASMQGALAAMQAKSGALQKESAYVVELFLKSHAHTDLPFFVDMRGDELYTEVRHSTHMVQEHHHSGFNSIENTDRFLAKMGFGGQQ